MNYVELINAVLYDLNETTIAETAGGLSGTRGVQTTVKKDINKAIRDIDAEYIQWPWHFHNGRYTLFGGKGKYKYPVKIEVSSVSGGFTINEMITGVHPLRRVSCVGCRRMEDIRTNSTC